MTQARNTVGSARSPARSNDPLRRAGQQAGKRAGAGTDLNDRVVWLDLRELDDPPQDGRICRKMLTEALFQWKTSRTGFEPGQYYFNQSHNP
jgi:hypothetical protein